MNTLPDTGDREIEVGHDIDFSLLDETPAEKKAAGEIPLADFVTPAQVSPKTLNKFALEDFMRASVVARPVRLPNNLDVRSKDPNYRLRWVEFKSEDGRRFNDCLNMGFRIAKKEEVVGLNSTLKQDADGIKYNDVVLMIIPCETIDGYYKYNALKALKMVSKSGVAKLAQNVADMELRSGINSAGKYANRMKNEISTFVPGERDRI